MEKVIFFTPGDAVEFEPRADNSQLDSHRLAASWRLLLRMLADVSRAATGAATKSAAKSRPNRVAKRVMARRWRVYLQAHPLYSSGDISATAS